MPSTLINPSRTSDGVEFVGPCSGEGDEYREIIVISSVFLNENFLNEVLYVRLAEFRVFAAQTFAHGRCKHIN